MNSWDVEVARTAADMAAGMEDCVTTLRGIAELNATARMTGPEALRKAAAYLEKLALDVRLRHRVIR